jgi:hypothetical protein
MYELREQVLCAVNSNGAIIHRHNAIGTQIVQLLPFADKVVVLENYDDFPRHLSNLYCLDSTLRSVWSAELPSATDGYIGPLDEFDGKITCSSWECWRCMIDPVTGRILDRVFTK